ncbi:hypothetical protein B0T25DRAFT_192935 [Lasiosphaeria hispida]|uniref:Uncharacterized protein n=1 Tax=Lasiosphaeria hispida TaxID=260671 RepID=A0AAJ0HHN1_9PEZI|nr:hypothetical protein B0T25DRAFT_192935 [Lasiosphaeria hispida]
MPFLLLRSPRPLTLAAVSSSAATARSGGRPLAVLTICLPCLCLVELSPDGVGLALFGLALGLNGPGGKKQVGRSRIQRTQHTTKDVEVGLQPKGARPLSALQSSPV